MVSFSSQCPIAQLQLFPAMLKDIANSKIWGSFNNIRLPNGSQTSNHCMFLLNYKYRSIYQHSFLNLDHSTYQLVLSSLEVRRVKPCISDSQISLNIAINFLQQHDVPFSILVSATLSNFLGLIGRFHDIFMFDMHLHYHLLQSLKFYKYVELQKNKGIPI
jgi:hypothetical protein